MEYYWAMKRDGVLTLATRRMTLEDILLSERSQTPKVTYCVVPFKRNAWDRQIHRDRKQVSGRQGQRKGGRGVST